MVFHADFSQAKVTVTVNKAVSKKFHPKKFKKIIDSHTVEELDQRTDYLPPSPDLTISKRRIALVIGNANYVYGQRLSNPIRDARDIARILKKLHFKVIKHENTSGSQMKKAIDNFGKKLKKNDVGLFFYAGHGVQVHGINYLIPTDANIKSENDVEKNCIRTASLLAKMGHANSKTNIIILDACRDNPFEEGFTRSMSRGNGLASMDAPSGSLIAYSTAPGRTALDGRAGQNGVYTAALLKHLQIANIPIEFMFQKVRATVGIKTSKKQIPWESTSLTEPFYFKIKR